MIGKYIAKLDDKNRLIVPAKLRQELGDLFYVTIGANDGHHCLTIYPAAEWQRLSSKFNDLPIARRAGATSLFFMNAVECVPDKQYRIGIPQFLLKYAGIEQEVMVAGVAGQAEIWDIGEYNRFEMENLTPEKLISSLGEIQI